MFPESDQEEDVHREPGEPRAAVAFEAALEVVRNTLSLLNRRRCDARQQ